MVERTVMESDTVTEMFHQRTVCTPDLIAYEYVRGEEWVPVTFNEYGKQVEYASLGFERFGVGHKDCVAIWGDTMPEWTIAALGAMGAGAHVAGIYQTSTVEQAAYILNDSKSRILVVDRLSRLQGLEVFREQLPHLQEVVVWCDRPDGDWAKHYLADVMEQGRQAAAANRSAYETLRAQVKPEDFAVLVYTSGTTGMPKGVILTHHNCMSNAKNLFSEELYQPGDSVVAFLPMSHVAEFTAFLGRILGALTAYFCPDFAKVPQAFKDKKPTIIVAVPRVYEKVHKRIVTAVQASPERRRKLFEWAWGLGDQVARLRAEGKAIPLPLYAKHKFADRLVLSKVREQLGGRVRVMITAAAPIDQQIIHFFNGVGILMLEAYGLSESCGASHINLPDAYKVGTVGKAIEGLECIIAEDGEILMRGATIFSGYLNRPEDTAEMLDADGWLHTGDIGEIDAEGFLRITDRKKNLIITAGGKNVAPAGIELLIKREPVVSQVVVLGDRKPYLIAVITVAQDFMLQQEIDADTVRARIEQVIKDANKQLPRYEQVKKFHIVFDREFSVESGEMTPTMKIKRNVVAKNFAEVMEDLYGSGELAAAD